MRWRNTELSRASTRNINASKFGIETSLTTIVIEAVTRQGIVRCICRNSRRIIRCLRLCASILMCTTANGTQMQCLRRWYFAKLDCLPKPPVRAMRYSLCLPLWNCLQSLALANLLFFSHTRVAIEFPVKLSKIYKTHTHTHIIR